MGKNISLALAVLLAIGAFTMAFAAGGAIFVPPTGTETPVSPMPGDTDLNDEDGEKVKETELQDGESGAKGSEVDVGNDNNGDGEIDESEGTTYVATDNPARLVAYNAAGLGSLREIKFYDRTACNVCHVDPPLANVWVETETWFDENGNPAGTIVLGQGTY
jgi:hypothetical protein